jgi:hypothetical protein
MAVLEAQGLTKSKVILPEEFKQFIDIINNYEATFAENDCLSQWNYNYLKSLFKE